MSRTRTNNAGTQLRPPSAGAPGLGGPRPTGLRRKHSTGATLEIEALLEKKLPMLDQGVDYFTLFGLPIGASPDDVRSTYFMLARKLHPDRLSAIGIEDDDRQAQRLMACINEAFAVLNDPIRRAQYISILNRGGEAAIRAEEQKADELAMKVMRAEEEFRQGEMMLRREQIAQAVQHFTMAVELAPKEPEYQALLAWAQFAAAPDKSAVAQPTRKALVRAAEANSESPTAHFYLGRVERMLGREKEALYCFYQVLKIKPNHSEATSEARILEQRIKARR
jgi:tetratricopeptide (TPR) repeat protein